MTGQTEADYHIPQEDIDKAISVIADGGVVAFPTETYYGLAVDPFNNSALSRLFALKRRPPDKPVLILISELSQLKELVQEVPPPFERLMKELWPGPTTLVFQGIEALPEMLTGYSGTVGVRISSHPVAQRLSAAAGQAITATSANFSGQPAATDAKGVFEQLGPDVDFVLDGGETPGGMGSTIIGYEDDEINLIRPGVISFDEILKRLGR